MDTLATMIARVRVLCGDENALQCSDTLIEESLRICLAEIDLAGGQSWSLCGLDGATITDLPGYALMMLAPGAAARAVRSDNLSRAEDHPAGTPVAEQVSQIGAALLAQFESGLQAVRRTALAESLQAPYGAWLDE